MKPVAETIASLGTPVFMHTVGEDSSPSAVIARWRHGNAEVDIGESDFVRVAISLQDGQHVRQRRGNAARGADIKAGSISILPAHERTKVRIEGEADILQIFLRETFLEAAVEGQLSCLAMFNAHDSELQAAAMQLFVAATRKDPDDALLLESGIYRIAGRLRDHTVHEPSGPVHGGLSPAAHRRVNDMIAAAVDDISVPSPTLAQLADAVNLSINHFIRAFRQQTGVTPHRHVVISRLERGIGLLKKPGTSVAEIADQVGFATPAHFVATFRRTMGVTPGAFRTALLS